MDPTAIDPTAAEAAEAGSVDATEVGHPPGEWLRDWMERYLHAWRTDEGEAIEALFTEQATYSTGPWDEPWLGLADIVTGWVARGDHDLNWEFTYDVVVETPEVGVISGITRYFDNAPSPDTEYANVWIIEHAGDGRASAFSEVWVERPRPEA